MPPGSGTGAIVRCVRGETGQVAMQIALALRPGYGTALPLLSRLEDGAVQATAGADTFVLRANVKLAIDAGTVTAPFTLPAGEAAVFVLQYGADPGPLDASAAVATTSAAWRDWAAQFAGRPPHLRRSLLTLKALIYTPTGGMVAAPTTSLPEQPGGSRNWDYRYCWLRDSALAVSALLRAGLTQDAASWRGWLQRAIGSDPAGVQIMYGLGGERDLPEWEADWLPGYHGARPVRIGNAAHGQLQLDVFGEVMDALHRAAMAGLGVPPDLWALQCGLLGRLLAIWQQPDEGIWETRGGRRRFVFSQVMAWVAFDRGIRTAEAFGLPAPLDVWQAVRAEIHATVCRDGFDAARGSFTQSFGSPELDASALMIPLVGFLPPDDPRVRGTVAAIERDLLADGLVRRYRSESGSDGLPPGEGVFLACSFWLVEAYALQGRVVEAEALFARLLGLCNDAGLLAEEYDPATGTLLGNFPQGFSHLALVNAALTLDAAR
jgi:GH15 family glucan-1,4-alpha-glucosidase